MTTSAEWDGLKRVFDRASQSHKPASSPAMNWKVGDLCWVDGKHIGAETGRLYEGKVIEWGFSSKGGYLEVSLEITATVKGLDGREITKTWVHPKSVQSYKLRKRVA